MDCHSADGSAIERVDDGLDAFQAAHLLTGALLSLRSMGLPTTLAMGTKAVCGDRTWTASAFCDLAILDGEMFVLLAPWRHPDDWLESVDVPETSGDGTPLPDALGAAVDSVLHACSGCPRLLVRMDEDKMADITGRSLKAHFADGRLILAADEASAWWSVPFGLRMS